MPKSPPTLAEGYAQWIAREDIRCDLPLIFGKIQVHDKTVRTTDATPKRRVIHNPRFPHVDYVTVEPFYKRTSATPFNTESNDAP